MLFSQYLQEVTKAPKPPKRPNKDLIFKDKSLWTQDLQSHWGDFKIFKDDYDNEYAMTGDKTVVFGIWHAKDSDGIVFVQGNIPTPGVDLYEDYGHIMTEEDWKHVNIYPDHLLHTFDYAGVGIPNNNSLINYIHPPYTKLHESGDSYLGIQWSAYNDGVNGFFHTDDGTRYKIIIRKCKYPNKLISKDSSIIYNGLNISFEVLVNGAWTTNVTETPYFRSVIGTVQNGVNDRITSYEADFVLLVANPKDSKSESDLSNKNKIYGRLADRYSGKFGTVYKNIKNTLGGIVTIIISHRVPQNVQHAIYNYALKQSELK